MLTTGGAVELPCTLTFTANSIMISKVEALQATRRVDSSVGPGYPHNVDDNSPINKKFEVIELADDDSSASAAAQL